MVPFTKRSTLIAFFEPSTCLSILSWHVPGPPVRSGQSRNHAHYTPEGAPFVPTSPRPSVVASLKKDLPRRSTGAIRSHTFLVIQRPPTCSVSLSGNRSSLVGDSLAVELPALTRTALVRIQVPQPEKRILPSLGGCKKSASLSALCFWKPGVCSIDLLFSQFILSQASILRRIVRTACK